MKLFQTARANHSSNIPLFGFGTWMTTGAETKESVLAALALGYRYIDTAQMYKNEEAVGQALLESKIAREDIFLVSKLDSNNHSQERVESSLRESLAKMGTSYVDCFLVHSPGSGNLRETWQAMQEMVALGLARSVGVSNFGVAQMAALSPHPTVNQFELHVWNQQTETVEYCRQRGVCIIGHCPVARMKHIGKNQVVRTIASELGISEVEVALRWSLTSGFCTIPKSVSHAQENWDYAAKEPLSDCVMERLKEADEGFAASTVSQQMHLSMDQLL
jgi:diketogulonate reductase-like aldo/keto reductase